MRLLFILFAFLILTSSTLWAVDIASELNEESVVQKFGNIQELANSVPFGDTSYDARIANVNYSGIKAEIIRLLRIPGEYPTGYLYGRFERATKSFETVSKATVNDVFDASKGGQLVEAHVNEAYEVNIYVPSKIGMFSGNNDAYVYNCTLSWTEPLTMRKREESHDISAWLKRGTNRIIPLPEIGKDVHIQLRCAAKPNRGGRTLVHLQVAVPDIIDDEQNPNYDVIVRLRNLGPLPVSEEERILFIETLQDIMMNIKGVDVISEEVAEDDGQKFELRRKLEYVKYLLGGRAEDIARASDEISKIIDEFCGDNE
jgi:hypothetical protein